MKKCPNQTLGYGIRRTPIVLGLSAALCMPTAFSYANVGERVDRESVQSVLQTHTVKGTIVDETGEPMIGVSVIVKGQSTVGTITDFDGNFVLDVPAGKGILEVSYIGYKTQEVAVGKNAQITIKMEPDTQALDEVVVIGYGAVKKRDLTGAVSSVKNEDITLLPILCRRFKDVLPDWILLRLQDNRVRDLNCNCVEHVHLQLVVTRCLLLMVCQVIILR